MAVRAEHGQPGTGPDPLEVRVMPMRRRHLRAVLVIESRVYPKPWSASLFMSELAMRSSRAYTVARAGQPVVGYCGLMLAGEDAHITTLAVDPAWQRRQIGSRLMLHMTRLALRRDARNMTLEVRVNNREAQALYRLFGFHPAGVRRNYYAETNEDALVMWADGIDAPDHAARLERIEASLRGTTVVEDNRW